MNRIPIETLAIAFVAGCAFYNPGSVPLGTPLGAVRESLGAPVARFALPRDGQRLEYARGASGRETYMLDFDAQGLLVASEQVRTEANFATITPGLGRDELLLRMGHPSTVFAVPRQHLWVWNYHFFTGDCRWFQVSVSDTGSVLDASIGRDPECDYPEPRN